MKGLIRTHFNRSRLSGLVILPKAEQISPLVGADIPLAILKMDSEKL
jgi:hypothetical protein